VAILILTVLVHSSVKNLHVRSMPRRNSKEKMKKEGEGKRER
jgi:hypothetical protein